MYRASKVFSVRSSVGRATVKSGRSASSRSQTVIVSPATPMRKRPRELKRRAEPWLRTLVSFSALFRSYTSAKTPCSTAR
ncbi:hypothetical protein D3C59_01275 [Streptomyces sp. SHP22-7]|nr:hypothetical protein D3C59_01275 [Streptomyces sp. SHP22-7]